MLSVGLVSTSVLGVLAAAGSAWWAAGIVPIASLAGILVLFFRNPSRAIPDAAGLLVAPADGRVVDIERVDEPDYVKGPCRRIGIFLSVLDVHVNRAPAAGRVEWAAYRPGRCLDARDARASEENESNRIGIACLDAEAPPGTRLVVKQVSGAIARRIVCPLRPPVRVARGGLVGMIKYGSRTELYIPDHPRLHVAVRVGQKVQAGSSVVATWSADARAAADPPTTAPAWKPTGSPSSPTS